VVVHSFQILDETKVELLYSAFETKVRIIGEMDGVKKAHDIFEKIFGSKLEEN
jgi:hypothetical protein